MSGCLDRSNNEDPDKFPCDPDGELASCCGPGQYCASNGLCIPFEGDFLTPFFAEGCTVDRWEDPTCLCFESDGNGVSDCGEGRFCCYGLGGCDCDDDSVAFTADPVRIVTSIPLDAAERTSTTSTASSTSSTSTPSITPTSTSSTTRDSSTAAVDEPSESNDDEDSSMSTALGVGLGVGIPLVLALVAGIWWYKKKAAKKSKTPAMLEGTKYDPASSNGAASELPQSQWGHDQYSYPRQHDQNHDQGPRQEMA